MIHLALVDPKNQLRHIFGSLSRDNPEIQLCKIYRYPEEISHIASLVEFDILVVSASLPADGTSSLLRSINSIKSGTKSLMRPRVLIVGSNESNEEVLRYIEAGARGYIRRSDSLGELVATIRSMVQGKAIISPDLAQALMARLWKLANTITPTQSGNGFAVNSALTPRECEVLYLLKRDLSNQEIAEQLSIEVGTVKNHVHNILEKLEVKNRRQAAVYALQDCGQVYRSHKRERFAPAD